MESTNAERRIAVYKLLSHKTTLKQLKSFSDHIALCNFTTENGWRGKTYVREHDVAEYAAQIRGLDLLDVNYLTLTDTCVLTEEQYKDYRVVAGLD